MTPLILLIVLVLVVLALKMVGIRIILRSGINVIFNVQRFFSPPNVPKMFSDEAEMGDPSESLRFVCISDTHSNHRTLVIPDGDVLIHSGDFTRKGTLEEVTDFNDWLGTLPHKYKIVVAGNHDLIFDEEWYSSNWNRWHKTNQLPAGKRARELITNAIYLECEETTISLPPKQATGSAGSTTTATSDQVVRIYGLPYQLKAPVAEMAFTLRKQSEKERRVYAAIPSGITILVSHGPPKGKRDRMVLGASCGSSALQEAIQRVRPRYCIFGHIHEGYGVTRDAHTTYINAALCDLRCRIVNAPIVFDLFVNDKKKETNLKGRVSSGSGAQRSKGANNVLREGRGGREKTQIKSTTNPEALFPKSREERENLIRERKARMLEEARKKFLESEVEGSSKSS